MTFAPGVAEFVDRCNRIMAPDSYKLPIEAQRELYSKLQDEFPYQIPEDVSWREISDSYNGNLIRFRIYRPISHALPGLIFYIRGGGYVMGSLDSHHSVAAEMASHARTPVVAVDFRLAPEHPFPTALEDCYRTLEYLHRNSVFLDICLAKVILAGDSSGGNMAVVLAMMCRDRKGPPLYGQALISPVLDFTRWRMGGHDVPLLTGGEMEFYTACYSPSAEQVSHPYVSPLIAGDFTNLPRAYIMGAEMDSLVTDAIEYARLLRKNGTEVELIVEPGLVHAAVRGRAISPAVQSAWYRFCNKVREMVEHDAN
ncbi:alpha/beta hydrolase [Pseudomonas oryzihabitans]|nr:alpha/beta hydrolase [Pseudomonas psychrotolerans]